jgi:hypothetical protein
MRPSESLHAGLLIAAQDQLALLVQTRGVEVQPADVLGLGVEVRIVTVQPVDTLMRLQVDLIQDTPDGGSTRTGGLGLFEDRSTGEVGRGILPRLTLYTPRGQG